MGIKDLLAGVWQMILDSNVLNLLSALLILVCGWVVALLVSKLVSRGLQKIGIGRSLSVCLPEAEVQKAATVEKVISKSAYYLILLITVLACLTALNLTDAAAPISVFVSSVTAYMANILAAGALLFVAWVVATALQYGVLTALHTFHVDEKISEHLNSAEGKECNLSFTVGTAVYWLTFVFFAPAILSALKITGITQPVQNMVGKVLNCVPNILAAAGIVIVGLFFANIIRKVVTNLLSVVQFDTIGEKAGIQLVFGQKSISKLTGLIAYVLIAIPVVISALSYLNIRELSMPIGNFFQRLLDASGNIFGAALLLFAAYVAGSFVAGLITQLLSGFGFNKLMGSIGFCRDNPDGSKSASAFVGKLTLVAIMFMAIVGACELLGLVQLAELIRSFGPFAGNILVGVVVFIIGIFLSNLAAEAVRSKGFESQITMVVVKVVVLVFAGAIALHRMDIGGDIVENAFSLILGAFALAAALAFGLGGREFAAAKLKEWTTKAEKDKKE